MKSGIIFLLAVLFAGPALGAVAPPDTPPEIPCACAERPFERRFGAADAVFAGTVTGIAESREFTSKSQADLPVRVQLKVDEIYKGKAKADGTFELHTSLTKYTCTGHPFEMGGQYLVFAYERKDYGHNPTSLYRFPLDTFDVGGLCGGTKKFTAAAEDLKQLKPAVPKKGFFRKLLKNK